MTTTLTLPVELVETVVLETPDACPATDGDPICPMTGTTSCAGADARNCTAC